MDTLLLTQFLQNFFLVLTAKKKGTIVIKCVYSVNQSIITSIVPGTWDACCVNQNGCLHRVWLDVLEFQLLACGLFQASSRFRSRDCEGWVREWVEHEGNNEWKYLAVRMRERMREIEWMINWETAMEPEREREFYWFRKAEKCCSFVYVCNISVCISDIT